MACLVELVEHTCCCLGYSNMGVVGGGRVGGVEWGVVWVRCLVWWGRVYRGLGKAGGVDIGLELELGFATDEEHWLGVEDMEEDDLEVEDDSEMEGEIDILHTELPW